MPIPAVIGLSALASTIASLFNSLMSWLMQFVTRKAGIMLLVVAAMVTLAAGFFAAVELLIDNLAVAVPASVNQAAGMFFPSNTDECLAAVLTAHVVKYAYGWNVRILQIKAAV